MTNGSSQGIFVIVALVIFGIFVLISYLLFRDTMKPSLARIYCDAFTITSKNTGFGKLGNCGVDSEGQKDKIQRTYYKIREATPEKGWSEVWVLVKELDNGHVEIIDSGNKDQFSEGDLGATLIGDISFPDTVGNGLVIENIGVGSFRNAKFANVMKLPDELIILDDYSLQQSHFSGEARFPERLEIIGIEALRDSRFTGELPEMPNIKEIRDNAFKESEFEGNLPNLPNVDFVGKDAFKNSQFTGTFNGIGSNVGTGGSGSGNGSGGSGSDSGSGSGSGSDSGSGGTGSGSSSGSGSSHGYSSDSGVVIADGAFENSNFTGKPNIPSNVSIIGDNAFKNSNFTEIDLKDNTELVVIGDNAFENSIVSGVLYLPDSVRYIGDNAFYSSNFINKDWVLPKKLEYIGDYAFYNSTMQGNLTMKENLKHIGNYAFYNSYKGNTSLVRYTVGDGGYYTKYNNSLILGESLEYIGDRAFHMAQFGNDFDMTLSPNLNYIGDYSFTNSYSQLCKYRGTYKGSWGNTAGYYYNAAYRNSIIYNNKIKYIGERAFYSAQFEPAKSSKPDNLQIGKDAFYNAFKDYFKSHRY